MTDGRPIRKLPRGLAIFSVLGPGLIWCSDMIGSGEVILTTRNGAILGVSLIWVIVLSLFLKYWIGVSGAHYTVCTGEGMMDMFDRMPGPRHWLVWIILGIQLVAGSIGSGALASAAGAFVSSVLPVSPRLAGWVVCAAAFGLAWSGGFRLLKLVMGFFVALIVLGVFYVAATVFPSVSQLIQAFTFKIPDVPAWAIHEAGVHPNPWREILPLLGWVAGGFGTQVWYTYWVIGEGYGMTVGRGYGRPADVDQLRSLDESLARRIKGWCRAVYLDGALAMLTTGVVTISFLIAGAGILGANHLAPQGPEVAFTLSRLFSTRWGSLGATLFLISGAAALISTLTVQLAGWPRLLADAFRICVPAFGRSLAWRTQFRLVLVFLFVTNVVVVYALGYNPVSLVKLAAVCDGLLLTPVQAVAIGVGLFVVMPGLFGRSIYRILKPHWIFGLFLALSAVVFGFCVFKVLTY
jgi:Mn2+/Fe2+ NRAMP family transporter